MVKTWVKRTPDNFRFTAKFPKVITHDKYLVDVEDEQLKRIAQVANPQPQPQQQPQPKWVERPFVRDFDPAARLL